MRVFLTGATGFVGTAVGRELLAAGHRVLGLARTGEGLQALAERGIEPYRGELTDLKGLVAGARACDGVIHTAFIHDFTRFEENIEIDRRATLALLEVLEGSGKPLLTSSGVAGAEDEETLRQGRFETDAIVRAASGRGVRAGVIRLPPTVHGDGDKGFIRWLIDTAREKGVSAYIGDGAHRWSAVHRLDAARLYRLALEAGDGGRAYNAIGDEGVPTREIAAMIGQRLGAPVVSKRPEEAADHFGFFLGTVFGMDRAASAGLTREWLDWRPTHPGLIADLEGPAYFGARGEVGA